MSAAFGQTDAHVEDELARHSRRGDQELLTEVAEMHGSRHLLAIGTASIDVAKIRHQRDFLKYLVLADRLASENEDLASFFCRSRARSDLHEKAESLSDVVWRMVEWHGI